MSENKYWYNKTCNVVKHPGQLALEKIVGSWYITFKYKNPCGNDAWLWANVYSLEKHLISDDNSHVVQFDGNVFSIADSDIYRPPPLGWVCDECDPYYHYAILDGQSDYTYLLKDINTNWGTEAGHCYLDDGTRVDMEWPVINVGDTVFYYFDLTNGHQINGKAHLVNADVWLDIVGKTDGYDIPTTRK